MKHLLILILFSCLSLVNYAQHEIKGVVYSSDTKDVIPYISLGIEGKATGTVSNSAGEFILKISENISSTDSVTFSSIGFKTAKYPLAYLTKEDNKIYLAPDVYELADVVVKNIKNKNIILGRNHAGSGMLQCAFFNNLNSPDRISGEMGMLFKTKNDCRVNSMNFYIQLNNYKKVKFRLTFYSIENGLPKDIIINQNIIFEINDKYTGWYKIDLKPYSISIQDRKYFAATLTLLEEDFTNQGNWFTLPGALLPNFTTFRRNKAMDGWTKKNHAISMFLETTAYLK